MLKRSHVGAFVLGAAIAVAVAAGAGPERKSGERRFSKLDVFARVLSYVEANYVEDIDERKLVYGAVKGMMRTLDPHSDFMTPEEFADMRADTDGEFGGIGIEVTEDKHGIVVVEPLAGSPAARAGLVRGDRIVAIDGITIGGRTPGADGTGRLRGRPGTSVRLDVERKGWERARSFVIVREMIHV